MEIQTFINNLSDKSCPNIRKKLFKRGIMCSYDYTGRMVFYTSKNQRFSDADPLKLECNGLVFDAINMKPLVIPTLTCRSNIDANVVNVNLSNDLYDVLLVEDGTIINLYWWAPTNSWCISTARSFDLTDKNWSLLTYKEIVQKILGHNTQKFYESLDKSHSYTFGIKTEDMHPFRGGKDAPINKMWFIQSANLKTLEISFKFPNEINIPEQTPVDMDLRDITTLYNGLNQALDDFIYEPSTRPLYGYMLRSRDPSKTGAHSNVVIESSLLQKIRQLYYHSSLSMYAYEMKYDRDTYIIVYSYLDTNRHILFRKLFPHFIAKFDVLDTITANIVKNIIIYVKINKIQTTDAKVSMYVRLVYDALNKQYQLKATDRNLTKITTSFVLTQQWCDMYYDLYTTTPNPPTIITDTQPPITTDTPTADDLPIDVSNSIASFESLSIE